MSDPLIYEKKILVRSEQVDMTRSMRISELFRIMEEASIAHTEQLGCTRDKTLDRGLLWVITRQSVEIGELPRYDEEITVQSWQGIMMHVLFPRFYEIWRGDRCIVKGQAIWMLIDEQDRTMVMPEDYGISIPGLPGAEDVMIPAIRIPAVDPSATAPATGASGAAQSAAGPSGKPPVAQFSSDTLVTRFSQVDINGHMNNTRYFDMIDDALYASGLRGRVPRAVNANYLAELRAGDRFDLSGYREGADPETPDKIYFEGSDKESGTIYFRVSLDY